MVWAADPVVAGETGAQPVEESPLPVMHSEARLLGDVGMSSQVFECVHWECLSCGFLIHSSEGEDESLCPICEDVLMFMGVELHALTDRRTD